MNSLPYRCSFRYLWIGIKDAYAAKVETVKSGPQYKPPHILLKLLVPILAIFMVAQGAATTGASLVGALSSHGSFKAAAALSVVAVGLIATFPVYFLYRMVRKTQATCRRGWELDTEARRKSSLPAQESLHIED